MSASLTDKLARTGQKPLTKYDPQKGLKTVAVAEAAEKHYARAKDATKLQQAIRAKLTAQAEFVYWWDTKGPGINHGGPRSKGKKQDDGSGILLDSKTISRWRSKLNDPDTFETTYERALARYLNILELEKGVHVEQNSGNNEWYTPPEFIASAREVLGDIDCDPASSARANTIVKAHTFFTADSDGLAQATWGRRVWMNPPYAASLVDAFVRELVKRHEAGEVEHACVLTNNATETQWGQQLLSVATAVCFLSGRVRYLDATGTPANTPLQGQMVVYLGADAAKFSDVFGSAHGTVLRRV